MLDKLGEELYFQQTALNILNRRQDVLAANIANADTPGYQARDIHFTRELRRAIGQGQQRSNSLSLSLTSWQHIPAEGIAHANNSLLYRIPDQPSADGNTVDMDRERVNFADNGIKYQASLSIINGQIKSMMSVLFRG
ncbi:flagellar biosynthesis protein FlgB [Sodalis-like endosymbiont of Proechinophthirus fluctus]|uniref:flagellar basal body rod protein FlgB n=1 Tax=Sodalis-like endosymbiont of Proechinophthirus fluctus TaxID=1462730 RepID=UPI0007A7E833|nr:flagellar basal body rod protein FlgB [Sodalis-like endosymbiont of Proechinophthirus fluctus]KYP97222.1 flagellar biosynthesis protein FlgB [Sodalis-like endosymbiont of Proechinophthirus fluctus]